MVGVVAEPGEQLGRIRVLGQLSADLDQDRPAVDLQAFDDPAFPRAAGVQRVFQGVGDGAEQLVVVAGRRKRRPVHLSGHVETRRRHQPFGQQSLDPVRPGQGTGEDRDGSGHRAGGSVRIRRA